MGTLGDALREFWDSLVSVVVSFNFPIDLIDILVVAYIVYHGVRLVRETRAMQLLKGIAAILIIYFVATELLNMIILGFFVRTLLSVGIYLLVVLFQPELRSALEKMGRSQLMGGGQTKASGEVAAVERLIDVLATACSELSSTKTGALMVIERTTRLGDVINTGTLVDSLPSAELIGNIFFTNSPLHDGAMIIRGCRIHAAGCYLPLSQNTGIARELGTRHRAALGMSEVSDAVILIVSEETGAITMASESKLQRGLSEKNLRSLLRIKLLGSLEQEQAEKKKWNFAFWKGKKHEE